MSFFLFIFLLFPFFRSRIYKVDSILIIFNILSFLYILNITPSCILVNWRIPFFLILIEFNELIVVFLSTNLDSINLLKYPFIWFQFIDVFVYHYLFIIIIYFYFHSFLLLFILFYFFDFMFYYFYLYSLFISLIPSI